MDLVTYLAHILESENKNVITQTVSAHSRNAADISGKCLEDIGLFQVGYLAGLLHDIGKCKAEFQDYLLNRTKRRGEVNHTFAGCRMILEFFHSENACSPQDATAELLAYAVGAHHGLFDCVNQEHQSGFLHRLKKENIGYGESRSGFLSDCAKRTELEQRFQEANLELSPVYEKISNMVPEERAEEFAFYLGILARLLCSAVMEGDRLDTATFMGGSMQIEHPSDLTAFWRVYLNRVEEKLQQFPPKTAIDCARGKISAACRAFSEKKGGIYRLNVPTGAGKTLSSLRYALAHAAHFKKRRIFFVSPLLSILEQNAQVIRNFIQDDSVILEHHSNIISDSTDHDCLDPRELAIESWNYPILITTMVQLLNTFFLGKPASIRRFHSLCNAVVVIDEVQTVPTHMLSLFNLTLNFLSEICNTTFLLCSATQPCLETTIHPLLHIPESLVPYDEALFAPFLRTQLIDAGAMTLQEIGDFALEQMHEINNLLVVCNKRQQAAFLHQYFADQGYRCFHLSASMCIAHRRTTLKAVKQMLSQGNDKVICVSTQVIEAGVDISFQRVIRFSAGMDSVIQAAGRCNRNAECKELAPVYVVSCKNESLKHLSQIQQGKNVTISLLDEFRRNQERFRSSLSSNEAIAWYYRHLYQMQESEGQGYQGFSIASQKNTLFSMLSLNDHYYDSDCSFFGKFYLNQAFKLAGMSFQVFDNDTIDALVPYEEGKCLIDELDAMPANPSITTLQSFQQRVRPYTISLYTYQQQQLEPFLRQVQGIWILAPEAYDSNIGLSILKESLPFLEV